MYTVGIKRRFWFGFAKYSVKEHGWANGCILLNLAEGGQLQFPAYRVSCVKVYNDIENHLEDLRIRAERRNRELERQAEEERRELEMRLAIEREVEARLASEAKRQPEIMIPQVNAPVSTPADLQQAYKQAEENEVMRRAAKRVNDLFS